MLVAPHLSVLEVKVGISHLAHQGQAVPLGVFPVGDGEFGLIPAALAVTAVPSSVSTAYECRGAAFGIEGRGGATEGELSGARGGGSVLTIMHGRRRVIIDPRIPQIPGRSTSGFYLPQTDISGTKGEEDDGGTHVMQARGEVSHCHARP